ncbi:MAG: hypothetical protein SFV32_08965 [Opitutaceae bacterium]|nr:hypothetical protein [Opitutaceae bacterium]
MNLLRHAHLLLALHGAVWAQSGLSTESPFTPQGGATGPVEEQTQLGDYQFVGIMKVGDATHFGFSRADGRAVWVPLGSERDGIAVLGRPAPDRVSVRVGGNETELRLKRAGNDAVTSLAPPRPLQVTTRPATMPAAVAPNNHPPPPQDPETAAQEREARMLVSDLLEIGMQQRKAYEEAQKKKANAQQQPLPPRPTQ